MGKKEREEASLKRGATLSRTASSAELPQGLVWGQHPSPARRAPTGMGTASFPRPPRPEETRQGRAAVPLQVSPCPGGSGVPGRLRCPRSTAERGPSGTELPLGGEDAAARRWPGPGLRPHNPHSSPSPPERGAVIPLPPSVRG